MTTQEKILILQSHPLFSTLKSNVIEKIAEKADNTIFPPKTLLISHGAKPKNTYIIYQGLIRIFFVNKQGEEIPLAIGEKNYIVGELATIDNILHSASIETLQETHVLSFAKEEFRMILITYPQVALNLLTILGNKLRHANQQQEDILSLESKGRLKNALKILAPHFPNNEITLSQKELALIVGVTQERVTELLHELADENLISLADRKIRLR
jgi:CRP-like cAMP-binding protein